MAAVNEATGAVAKRVPIKRIRALIITVLTVAVAGFTFGVSHLVHEIFDNFGPAVQRDLEWKVQRGAKELAAQADLGLAISDAAMVQKAFVDYRGSEDLVAIVAVDAQGKEVVREGEAPEPLDKLFIGDPDKVRRTSGHLVSWASAQIEGGVVGKIGVVISTRRIAESETLLQRIRTLTFSGGFFALIGGIAFVMFATRAIALRDAQLADYAAGLELKVAERTAELDRRNQGMRLVLDHVAQGLITVDADGRLAPERSAVIDTWLGEPRANATFEELIRPVDPKVASAFVLGLEALRDDVLPIELVLDQMPARLSAGERVLKLEYTPIVGRQGIKRLLIVMTDITADIARERMEKEQRELVAIFQRLSADRNGVLEFVEEGGRLIEEISNAAERPQEEQKRAVHTLKGGAGLFGFESLAEICHGIEDRMAEEGTPLVLSEVEQIRREWRRSETRILELAGRGDGKSITLTAPEYQELLDAVVKRASHAQLEGLVRSFSLDPIETRLARFGEQAESLAKRLEKAPVEITLDGGGVRIQPHEWKAFWSVFNHVVRNAVDHGIEDVETRRHTGKSDIAKLMFVARKTQDGVVVAIRDDGRGIDWEKVGEKARAKGLPHDSSDDLQAALFADGLSTRDQASLISGRGVGLGAVQEVVTQMGGSIRITSKLGQGTTFEFIFPRATAVVQPRAHA